jgi:hypothetical protein
MSSDQPTFGGAIGEAGMNALDYMQGMEQQRFERDLAERTLAARMASAAAEAAPGFGIDSDTDRLLNQYRVDLERIDFELSGLDPEENRADYQRLSNQRNNIMTLIQSALAAGSGGGPNTMALLQQQAGGDGPISVNIGDSAAG